MTNHFKVTIPVMCVVAGEVLGRHLLCQMPVAKREERDVLWQDSCRKENLKSQKVVGSNPVPALSVTIRPSNCASARDDRF